MRCYQVWHLMHRIHILYIKRGGSVWVVRPLLIDVTYHARNEGQNVGIWKLTKKFFHVAERVIYVHHSSEDRN